ncbi:MAG: ABC transporter substrate-binding protein [Holosporaceae bacterium]|jgi:ABC-type transporter MlaC component|nr:ABC transporter substrate-binding protein [Holosporaceae bacterium]
MHIFVCRGVIFAGFFCIMAMEPRASCATAVDTAVFNKVANEQEVEKFAKNIFNAIFAAINEPNVNVNVLMEVVRKNFDIDGMLSRALGPGFNILKKDSPKLEKFVACFIRQLVELYESSLKKYKTASFSIKKFTKISDSMEYSLIGDISASGKIIPIELNICHGTGGQLQISGVIIDGIDITQVQHAEAISFDNIDEYVDSVCKRYAAGTISSISPK